MTITVEKMIETLPNEICDKVLQFRYELMHRSHLNIVHTNFDTIIRQINICNIIQEYLNEILLLELRRRRFSDCLDIRSSYEFYSSFMNPIRDTYNLNLSDSEIICDLKHISYYLKKYSIDRIRKSIERLPVLKTFRSFYTYRVRAKKNGLNSMYIYDIPDSNELKDVFKYIVSFADLGAPCIVILKNIIMKL
jgi:hypothetical protein